MILSRVADIMMLIYGRYFYIRATHVYLLILHGLIVVGKAGRRQEVVTRDNKCTTVNR